MKFRSLLVAALALAGAASAGAAIQTTDYGSYSLSYDDSTSFGGPSYNLTGGSGLVGFGWSVPTSVGIAAVGTNSTLTFALPDFTVTAKSGYIFSGAVTGSIGNLVFNEFNGGATSAIAGGNVSIDGGPTAATFGGLTQTVTNSLGIYQTGYFSGSSTQTLPSFSSLAFSGGTLILGANAGPSGFASIVGQTQNKLEFTMVAAPVPEPESAAMMMVGLLAIGTIIRRRRQA